jgi:hypothetical protein
MRNSLRLFLLVLPAVGALAGCSGDSKSPLDNWTGKTFLLDKFPNSRWVAPKSGGGSSMGDYVPQFFIGVAAGSGDSLDITLATGLGGVQDMCSPTTPVPVTGVKYPDLQITAPTLPMRLTETDPDYAKVVPVIAHDVTLKNILPGRNENTPSGELTATLDMADAYPLFHLVDNPTKDSVCAAFADAGVVCQTCAFNGQPYCLTFRAVQLVATEFPTPIQKLSPSDIPASCP